MKNKFIEHLLSILFVLLIFIILYLLFLQDNKTNSVQKPQAISQSLNMEFIDFDNALHVSLLKETLITFYQQNADSMFNVIVQNYAFKDINEENLSNSNQLTWNKLFSIFTMYIKFVFVFIVVMGLTYYGVQTLGTIRFILMKQNQPPLLIQAYFNIRNINPEITLKQKIKEYINSLYLIAGAILKTVLYFILFSPAYVIAYSFKTKFDTDSIFFMILLGIISNGLLITYTQKFFTFLVTESRKGYVETAIVKNLTNNYSFNYIKFSSIFRIIKEFPDHVFGHIFMNAQYQYLSTLKEQAAFLISGLIIIEMALNIHNHLSYELLQNLLFENYIMVMFILFAIFFTVKINEILVDFLMDRQEKKYSNK